MEAANLTKIYATLRYLGNKKERSLKGLTRKLNGI